MIVRSNHPKQGHVICLLPLTRDGDRPPFVTRFKPLVLEIVEEIDPK